MDNALYETAMRLGDDGLILGQNLSQWCGHAPMLELDLSLANIALDLIGQATLFLGVAGDADQLAFHRDVLDFKNCLLVEQPNGDFAQTIARQFLFSNWQELMLRELSASREPQLAAIAAKSVKEVAYHSRFASEWIVRLGDGTEDSRARLVTGLDWMWRFVDELFEDEHAGLRGEWDARIEATLAEAGLDKPASRRPILGGRDGHHSEHLGHLLSEMQFLQRAYPGAQW
jgi:ring-1,2-phenylacetyl-CoA epoxidase subunit PaaC